MLCHHKIKINTIFKKHIAFFAKKSDAYPVIVSYNASSVRIYKKHDAVQYVVSQNFLFNNTTAYYRAPML
jgi:hypothetical protein